MQSAKDSLFVALCDRLAQANPDRVVFIDGKAQPAIVMDETLCTLVQRQMRDTFHVTFGAAAGVSAADEDGPQLMCLECAIWYASVGDAELGGPDRGRAIAEMDAELLQIVTPPRADHSDCTLTPPAPQPVPIFWSDPSFGELQSRGNELRRSANLKLFYYSVFHK